jgi:thioredoxin reductase
MTDKTIYDVVVIGAGPAGVQAAVSAAHQMRHVLLLDAGPISQRKGRAYWSKSVEFQDAPVFGAITGPKFVQALREWVNTFPEHEVEIGGRERPTGIRYQPAVVQRVTRAEAGEGERAPAGHLFELEASTSSLPRKFDGTLPEPSVRFFGRTVIVASGFEDAWPDIEADPSAHRLMERHRTLFRFAGNRRGWHVCIRCDGHLHVNQHLAVLATGDYAWYAARGAQDFTDKITVLTNGREVGLSEARLQVLEDRGVTLVTEKIVAHIGKGTDLMGLRLEDGRELFFDGFLLDEGQIPNTGYLAS